ncbi:MAG: hypothetical protein ACK4PI_08665 [Tepidisphaerales bacterium]
MWRSWTGRGLHPHWHDRVAVCARCPVARQVGKTVYCGQPLLHELHRRPEDGCGCPVVLKAQDPAEHCPLDNRFMPATRPAAPSAGDHDGPDAATCTCRWCASTTLKTPKAESAAA